MRVVAVIVILCGCRVDTPSRVVDAAFATGDGLVERLIVDSRLWDDVDIEDAASDRLVSRPGGDGATDASRNETGGGDAAGDAAGVGCQLLGADCPVRQGCYPFPFEATRPSGEARCDFQGAGGPAVPCQSQLECDGTTVCAAPGEPDSACQLRCDRAAPRCPLGDVCVALAGYPGVGLCR